MKMNELSLQLSDGCTRISTKVSNAFWSMEVSDFALICGAVLIWVIWANWSTETPTQEYENEYFGEY